MIVSYRDLMRYVLIFLFAAMLLLSVHELWEAYKHQNDEAFHGWLIAFIAEIGWFSSWAQEAQGDR